MSVLCACVKHYSSFSFLFVELQDYLLIALRSHLLIFISILMLRSVFVTYLEPFCHGCNGYLHFNRKPFFRRKKTYSEPSRIRVGREWNPHAERKRGCSRIVAAKTLQIHIHIQVTCKLCCYQISVFDVDLFIV